MLHTSASAEANGVAKSIESAKAVLRDRDHDRYDKSDRRDRDIGNGSGGYGSNWRNYGRGKRY
jgi:hypothetical protein